MSHPLLDVDRIDGPPGPFLSSIGEVFARFGMHTQASGNESYGLHIGDRRFFVKTTDPDVEVYYDEIEYSIATKTETEVRTRQVPITTEFSQTETKYRPDEEMRYTSNYEIKYRPNDYTRHTFEPRVEYGTY